MSDGIERMSGAPTFETPGRERHLEVSQGDEFQASTSVGNRGGAVRGVRVTIGGDVVERKLVEVESIDLHGGVDQERIEGAVEQERDEGGQRSYVVTFPGFEVAGALADDVDLSDMSDERGREVMRAHRGSRFSVYVAGHAVTAGDGELRIEISPVEAPERTESESAQVSVFPTSRRPLKAEEEPPPHTLRQMEKDETLFGLAHFNAPVGAWAAYATEAMRRWNERIAGAGDRYIRVEVDPGDPRPDEDEIPASAFDEQGVEELTRRLPELDQFSVVLSGEAMNEGRLEPHKSGGFSYFSCSGALAGGGEPAPALGFWLSTDGRSDDEIASLRDELAAVFDQLASSGYLLQGVSDTWAWAPALNIRSLPYEIVCGLNSTGHLRLDWLKRHLRAVTPQMWLGADLFDRLESDRLEEYVETDQLDDGALRLDLRSPDQFGSFEEVLAPILAGEEEWSAEASS